MVIKTTSDPQNGNHIMVMGSRVRNHYVKVLNEFAYDSSTGGHGIPFEAYIANLQANNKGLELNYTNAIEGQFE
jgi:hypothetical protein